MSLLQKQNKAFAASMAASASKLAKKTGPTVTSTPPPSQPAARTPEPRAPAAMGKQQVFSQPQDTGKGESIQTQVVYAVEYLKDKMGKGPMTLETILSYLSQTNASAAYKKALGTILQRSASVEYNSTYCGGAGGYKFKPKLSIFDGQDLLRALQEMDTFKGIDVKSLKEGWPSADKTIDELEAQHKIIVLRHKKDNTPRYVYQDVAELHLPVEPEFRDYWFTIRIPADHQTLIDELDKEGQLPAGKKTKKDAPKAQKVEKKQKKARRGGKVTNKHMTGIFKDFSKFRR